MFFDTINNKFLEKYSKENGISPKLYRSLIRSIIDEDEEEKTMNVVPYLALLNLKPYK